MNSSLKFNFYSLIILCGFQAIECFTDCDVYVISHFGFRIYKGCRKSFNTDSLDEPKTISKTIYRFSGIPYAKPPIGSLRFKKPVRKSYNGIIINSTNFGPICMQSFDSNTTMNEDCLYLNIWTPTIRWYKMLDVIVWIHGGAFIGGSGNTDMSLLALRDVIVVSLNYRVGVWGFLFGDRVEAPGNMGLWDQALAIQWVIDNIQSFGGNPHSITLMGESAGGMSISSQIVSPQSRNLFQRAIIFSGTSFVKFAGRPKAEMYNVSRRFASSLPGSCDNDNTWFDCLNNTSSQQLLTTQTNSNAWNTGPFYEKLVVIFGPIYGDQYLPKSVNQAIREGDFRRDINILISHNEMEGLGFAFGLTSLFYADSITYNPLIPTVDVTKDKIFSDIKDRFIGIDTIGEIIANKYTQSFGINPDVNAMRRAAVYALGDFILTCPTVLYGAYFKLNARHLGKVFQFRLTYSPSPSPTSASVWAEVTHSEGLNFAFGIPFSNDAMAWNANDRKISKIFLAFITHFAKTGIPPKINGNNWPEYSIKSDNTVNASYMEIHAEDNRLGRVHVDQYRGPFTDFSSPFNSECFPFWTQIFNDQF